MSIERELLIKAVEWMHELKYVWLEERDYGDRALLDLIADINKIEKLLYTAPPKREPLSDEDREEEIIKEYRKIVKKYIRKHTV